ncbi:hypothetical protein [Flagellimonas hadalis]|uniref:Uncharacterized protein n=1 Tax=Flagellimonas hadalis TaxID=2597517 RepID=A0A5N5IRP4_9FLAO|nr:hypothetical protein [Allomuricauda hadalis]KAB5490868.1 hypothetical protein FOT42_005410 [Allomuricauda hadalis]
MINFTQKECMGIAELQTDIIKNLLSIKDKETLLLLKEILASHDFKKEYKLSKFEQNFIAESISEYRSNHIISNDAVFKKNEEWLKE